MTERLERVRVTNHNNFEIRDRHDGLPYRFKPGEPLVVPAEVAQHLFGFPGDPEDVAVHISRRFGWNQPKHYEACPDDPDTLLWQRYVGNIRIEVEVYEMRRVEGPEVEIEGDDYNVIDTDTAPIREAPPPRRVAGRRGKAKAKRRAPPKRSISPRVAPPSEPAAPAPAAEASSEAPPHAASETA